MTINVEINKTGAKTTGRMIQEFTRKIQSTGIVRGLRNTRYYSKKTSDLSRKVSALKRLKKREETFRLIKDGKLTAKAPRTIKTHASTV